MIKKSALLLLLLITVLTFWKQQQNIEHNQSVQASNCQINQTICRQAGIQKIFNYTGIIRSGYLKIDTKPKSALGFIFYGKTGVKVQDQLKKYPTIVILGGGPGASSQFNNLRETGPFVIKKIFSPTIQDNKFTWAKQANLLYIDQPLGTGVSCLNTNSHMPQTLTDITKDFYKAFYQLFSQQSNGCFNSKHLKIPPSSPFYIFGQGFGGKYAAAIGAKIISEKKTGGPITGLKGIGIGDGFNAPFLIMTQIGNYAFSMSLLDYQQRVRVQKILLRAKLYQQDKQWLKLKNQYEKVLNYINQRTGISYYDITKDGFDEDLVKQYFKNVTNLQNFGFQRSIPFQTLSKDVYNKLSLQFMKDEMGSIEYLLKQEIPVLIYQGQDDAYVSPSGANKWVDSLTYNNSRDFRNLNFSPFKVNGQMMGSKKTAGKLTFQIINNAGHYVPQDNPQAAYYMFKDFIKLNTS